MHTHRKLLFLILDYRYAGKFCKDNGFLPLKVYATLMYNYYCQPVKE
ncbi:hypothetical protein SAMN05216582_11155 [Selenomonas ruminantium]|uniref:Uncharacterized protein n=1 Tax=Selenomonas ruminantium TaxID=971 RepID=A0A1M6U9G4_SELRU|nr:hypothetical protein SAMN05216582_11155 [Selenomonas ruminantium]